MSLLRTIKRDTDLEPYFFRFYEYLCISKEIENENEFPDEYLESLNILIEKLVSKYDIKGNRKYILGMIKEVLEYYVTKNTHDEIFEKNNGNRMSGNENIKSVLEKELDQKANFCLKCRSSRESLDFESLPTDVKSAFKTHSNEADYFLYCPKCDDYSIIFKAEMF